jgi:hypothetical protein
VTVKVENYRMSQFIAVSNIEQRKPNAEGFFLSFDIRYSLFDIQYSLFRKSKSSAKREYRILNKKCRILKVLAFPKKGVDGLETWAARIPET